MLESNLKLILIVASWFITLDECIRESDLVGSEFTTKYKYEAFNTNNKWQITKASEKLSDFTGSKFFVKNFVTTNCENCNRDDCRYAHLYNGKSGIVSFWYAMFNQENNSDTVFKFGTKINSDHGKDARDYWKFSAKNTQGKWKHKSVCLTFYDQGIYFVFYTNVSRGDEVGISNITFKAVDDCFPQSNLIKCSFEEHNLCNWTVAPRGVQWIKTKNSGIMPMSPQSDSFLVLASNSSFIQYGQLYSPSIINSTFYKNLTFWYYIQPSKYQSVTQLKIAISQYNTFRWIFESDIIKSVNGYKGIWQQVSLCTHVNNKEPAQFVFQGTVGRGSQIAIDDIEVTECITSLNLTCSFDDDICGWQMETNFHVPWIRIKNSNEIPQRPDGSYYLRVQPIHENSAHARLQSPLLMSASKLIINLWYYTDGNNKTTHLKVGLLERTKSPLLVNVLENKEKDNLNWIKTSVNFENVTENSMLIIDAKVDPGHCLAIDDIEVIFEPHNTLN